MNRSSLGKWVAGVARRRRDRRTIDAMTPAQRRDVGLGAGAAMKNALFDRAAATQIYLDSLK